jgi:hypothetical protein
MNTYDNQADATISVTYHVAGSPPRTEQTNAGRTIGQVVEDLRRVLGNGDYSILINRQPVANVDTTAQVKDGTEVFAAPRRSNGADTITVTFSKAGKQATATVVPEGATVNDLLNLLTGSGELSIGENISIARVPANGGGVVANDYSATLEEGDQVLIAPRRSNGTDEITVTLVRAGQQQIVRLVPQGTTVGGLLDILAGEGTLDYTKVAIAHAPNGGMVQSEARDNVLGEGDQVFVAPRRSNG